MRRGSWLGQDMADLLLFTGGGWAEEQAALMPVPPAFDGFIEQSKRVSPTCLISSERNR